MTAFPSPSAFVAADDLDILEAPEEVLTTLTREGKRKWMYPTASPGRFNRARLLVGWGLIAFFVGLPLVRIGGKPAVLLDVIARAFTFFGATFYPTDTFLLLLLALSVGLFILLFTAVFGRVWCGWACPQTVYLEFVFRPIERWIEGKEHVRARRDAGPMTLSKAGRKTAKHVVYLGLSLLLAHTFVAYFVGWARLTQWVTEPPAAHWGFFVLMAGVTGLVWFNFAYFREQMCTIACPYARIQSVLLDEDALIVSYDPNRGEPRGRGKQRDGLGDCVDCLACVRTCPTGIDIRDGLQMECIACTQCIDACDAIMDRTGQPRGLIRYTSERALDGKPTRVLRGRTLVYGLLFAVLASAFVLAVTSREAFDVNVGRVVGPPFTELPDGRIANRLRFRVRNQTPAPVAYTFAAATPATADLRIVGTSPITLAPQEMTRTEVWVLVPRTVFHDGTAAATFTLAFDDGTTRTEAFTLLGPSVE